MKNKNNVNPLLHALLPVVITIAYIIIGFVFDSGWAIGWILFLLIPIVETLINAIKTKNPSHFAYPVLVTAIFLFTGMMWGIWHPLWVMFVTIPAYYAICDAINKQRKAQQPPIQNQDEFQSQNINEGQNPSYYQPPVEVNNASKNNTSIVITAIICASVVAVIAIVCTFAWLSGGQINVKPISAINSGEEGQSVNGPLSIPVDKINNLDIEWVSGNVDIEYYDEDVILVEESPASTKSPMIYKIENNTLHIDEYDSKVVPFSTKRKKDLTVKLPKGFTANNIDLELVSANLTASNLNVNSFDYESVSGNASVSFSAQPSKIDIDTVSGSNQLVFPSDITGYSISNESVSGSIITNDFGNTLLYGDGATKIDVDSVSGNLIIEKNE